MDRRFHRARYDDDLMVTAFADRLKRRWTLDMIRGDLATLVEKALEPAHISV